MVGPKVIGNRRGKIRLGCLIWTLLGLSGGYVAFEYGKVYWIWFSARQQIEQHAGFAGQLEDSAILRRVVETVTELDLPPQARQVRLWRVEGPRGLRIALSYVESVDLLFTKRDIELSIEVSRSF
jgi:hypothetical protein